jgi:hypothetical protein
LQGGSAGHREHWSQHNFDGYGAKLGNACPPDGSLTGHPRPEISLFNCTESVPWARGSCNSFQSSTMIYRGGSFGRALARAPTSRAETSFCRSPVVKLLLIIQVPDASDKRGVGLLFHPINRFSLRFEGAERIVHVVLHKARLDKTGQGSGTRTRRHAPYIAPPLPESESVAQQVRQLGNVGGDAPGSALNHDCSHSHRLQT